MLFELHDDIIGKPQADGVSAHELCGDTYIERRPCFPGGFEAEEGIKRYPCKNSMLIRSSYAVLKLCLTLNGLVCPVVTGHTVRTLWLKCGVFPLLFISSFAFLKDAFQWYLPFSSRPSPKILIHISFFELCILNSFSFSSSSSLTTNEPKLAQVR